MSCPEPEVLSSFVDGSIADDERSSVEDHIGTCDECRATVAILAKAQTADRAFGASLDPAPRSAAASPVPAGPAITAQPVSPLAVTVASLPPDPALAITLADARDADVELRSGDQVGRYVIKDVIGKGGMGIVYGADDPELGREVALKVLRPDFARGQADAPQRIVREAQAMARIAHGNVVTVFDAGRAGDRVFIAMERVRGTSLRAWLARSPRTIAAIVDVFVAAGRGLVAAHDAGIVHRDFKPDNVLVGDDGRVRVTDFGLAIDASADDAVAGGTPAYMAPEQHVGGNVDPRTDQFGFCVALYEALYGRRPFAGSTRAEIADAIARGRIEPPPAGSRVPMSLLAIVQRGLAARPGDRFPTMAELLRALGRDRGRRPRQVAMIAAIALLAVVVALSADWIARTRAGTIAKVSFGSARSQLARLIELRTASFANLSDLVNNRDVLDQVVGHHDQQDFGLGTSESDQTNLASLHDNLRSADWVEFVGGADHFGIADAKGRLLYTSIDDATYGADVLAVPAIAEAYRTSPAVTFDIVRGDDPTITAAGLLGPGRPGLYVLFARTRAVAGQPRAVFVQLVEAGRMLSEISLGPDIALSLVGGDGVAAGEVPAPVLAVGRKAAADATEDTDLDGQRWLVQRYPVVSPGLQEQVGDFIMARQFDGGLGGLFPYARGVLGAAAALLALAVVLGLLVARQRDLSRRRAGDSRELRR